MVVQGVKNPMLDLLSLEDKTSEEVRRTLLDCNVIGHLTPGLCSLGHTRAKRFETKINT